MGNPGAVTTVAFVLPSFSGGGAERVLLSLLNGLNVAQVRPVLIVFDSNGPLRDLVDDGVTVVDLGIARLRHALVPLRRAIANIRPDVVVSTMAYMNLAVLGVSATFKRRPRVIVREANSVAATHRAIGVPLISRLLYRVLYPRADRIVCPSKLIADELATYARRADTQLVVLPNPVNVQAIRNAAATPYRASGEGSRFVAAGRLTYQKGFDRLVDLLVDAPPNCRVSILGEGPEGPALTEMVKDRALNERVEFVGFDANPWQWFAGADALLLPSRWEGMPNVALESLTCGTPVIAVPEAGGIGEIAESASPGSVTIAPFGAPFLEAMNAIEHRDRAALRLSLLPPMFSIDDVSEKFRALVLRDA